MTVYNSKSIVTIMASAFLAGACATTADRENQVAAEEPDCEPGHILSCHSSAAGRISDGRFGRNSRRSRFCSCEPESDLSRLAGPDLPREPR